MSRALLVALLALAPACSGDASGDPPAGEVAQRASVRGTVVDAATRAPVAGARVTAPGGAKAESDARGRFRIDDLAPGLAGELVAAGPDGSRGRVPLRPLRAGTLEVVLHLRKP